MSHHRSAVVSQSYPRARAAVSNGRHLLPGIDGRSAPARRYRDLVTDLAGDLGGAEALSAAEAAMVRQAAALIVRGELIQARIVNGETVDDEEATRVANAAARILNALRVKRRKREAVPSLAQHIATRGGSAGAP